MSNLYIIEEQKIVSLDLYRQLLKKGYKVIHENSLEMMNRAIHETESGIVITDLKRLKEAKLEQKDIEIFNDSFLKFSGTDTIVIDYNRSIVKHFSKPYDVTVIEDFLKEHCPVLTIIAPTRSIIN